MRAVCLAVVTLSRPALLARPGPPRSSTLETAMALVRLLPLPATDVAFFVTFGIFVVALVVLIVIVLMWVIRRDRTLRATWRQRNQVPIAPGTDEQPPAAQP
jgi:hypothetical protein